MEFTARTEGDYEVLVFTGQIDFNTSATVRDAIIVHLDAGRQVLVDLSGVTYIDSSMIASLVQGLRHGKGKGLSVGLVGVRDGVLKVLKLSSLDKIFTMHDSVADALAAG